MDISWAARGWMANVAANYTNQYTNTSAVGDPPIASWTTIDILARLDADLVMPNDWSRGTSITFTVQNLFNRSPPFVNAAGAIVVNYDPANASPLDRFLAVELRKSW
jgi:outer membrane receptor protein involved in Fe transport